MGKSDVPESLDAGFCTCGSTGYGGLPIACGYCERLRSETTLNTADLPAKYLYTQNLEFAALKKGVPRTEEEINKNASLFDATVSVQSRWNMLSKEMKDAWRKEAARSFANQPPTAAFIIVNDGRRILYIRSPEKEPAASSVGPSGDKEEVAASSVGPSGNKVTTSLFVYRWSEKEAINQGVLCTSYAHGLWYVFWPSKHTVEGLNEEWGVDASFEELFDLTIVKFYLMLETTVCVISSYGLLNLVQCC